MLNMAWLVSDNTALGHTVITLIAFIILVVIVHRFAWQPLMNILEKRKKKITDDLNDAARRKEESETANERAQDILSNARIEANKVIQESREKALELQDSIVHEARVTALDIRKSAEKDIERERQQMLREMNEQITNISVDIAKRIIEREVSAEDHQRYIDEFIEGLDEL
ncbi:F-type H+-transporting ATPase subunit b [Dolosicoccus paucivorans]|nr:F-type H+-transporting ATPase subunit b [Dolosicoccus paucivorans]